MATTINKCKKCGCEDTFLVSPAPCPTPIGCPDSQPCSEVFDAQCVVYTSDSIVCNSTEVLSTNTTVSDALQNIVNYYCQRISEVPLTIVEAGTNITVVENTVGNAVTYTISTKAPVKFVKEFTSSLDGASVTILGTDLAECGIPSAACNDSSTAPDFTYSVSYLNGSTWKNITNIDTVVLTTDDVTGNVTIVLGVTSPGDPTKVRVTIIG